jgi:hypothetical protein
LLNQPGWELFQQELDRINENAEMSLKARNTDNRDFYAGMCSYYNEIQKLVAKYRDEFKVRKEVANAVES